MNAFETDFWRLAMWHHKTQDSFIFRYVMMMMMMMIMMIIIIIIISIFIKHTLCNKNIHPDTLFIQRKTFYINLLAELSF